jgi:hypothetical protein
MTRSPSSALRVKISDGHLEGDRHFSWEMLPAPGLLKPMSLSAYKNAPGWLRGAANRGQCYYGIVLITGQVKNTK